MSTFCISRAIEGVTINGKEHLLNDDGSVMTFASREAALQFLDDNDIDADVDEMDT
jgi:hypothetical protein